MSNQYALRHFRSYVFLNCAFCCVLGANYLFAILQSPSLYSNASQHFNSPITQIGITAFNCIAYFSYLSLPGLCLGLIALTLLSITNSFKPLINFSTFFGFFALNAFLLIDSIVFYLFHFHLNKTLLTLFLNGELTEILSLSFMEEVAILIAAFALIIIQTILFKISQYLNISKWFLFLWFFAGLSYLLMLNITTNQYNNIFSQHLSKLPFALQLFQSIASPKSEQFLKQYNNNIEKLSNQHDFPYPKSPLKCNNQTENTPNIILIGIDTLRYDLITQAYMPNIRRFANQSIEFKNHYSGGNSTQAGMFSLFYSLPSNYWQTALNAKRPPALIQTLKEKGYKRKVIWSTNMRHPQVSKTLYLGIDHLRMNSAPGSDPIGWDKHTTKQGIKFLKKQKHNAPFFLHLFYHSLHAFCRTDAYKTYFKPSIKQCRRFTITNNTDPLPFKNRYLNIAKTLDEIIAPLLNEIKTQAFLKNTIVIITSDHGQEFNDNKQNYWGHASNYTKEQIKVPLIVYWPGKKAKKIQYRTTHYDVAPTLLKHALNCSNDFSNHSIGDDLFLNRKQKPLIAGSYVDMAMIDKNIITVFKTSGEIAIFDNKQKHLSQAPSKDTLQEFLKLSTII